MNEQDIKKIEIMLARHKADNYKQDMEHRNKMRVLFGTHHAAMREIYKSRDAKAKARIRQIRLLVVAQAIIFVMQVAFYLLTH